METVTLTRSSEVRAYLNEIGFTPKKSMGQNFLIDAHMRDLIAEASGTKPGERVIEIGPGLGVMTEALLERADHVTAIELDFRLSEHLTQRFSDRRNFTLIEGDATQSDWESLLRPDPVRVVSNLPYSVGSRILYDLANPARIPLSVTVMVQKDVADRILAKPGHDLYGLLSVRLGWAFEGTRIRNVPGACFMPAPRVGSTVLHLTRRDRPLCELTDPVLFEKLAQFAFTRRRKQLSTILKNFGYPQVDTDLDLSRRPETLELEEWAHLANSLSA
jgi:16S rRNA (adenine1518-N6/adenine1519-N6)-dimethyltransferase